LVTEMGTLRSCHQIGSGSNTFTEGNMIRTAIFWNTCLLGVFAYASAQPIGADFYEELVSLPHLYSNVESHYLSSFDRSGGNDDGFRGTYSQLYIDDNGEHVIFDEKGPGCVYNFWFTGTNRDLHWGKLRFYFDGEVTARFEIQEKEFFSGQSARLFIL
ncbi:MAG: hypothetical protein ACWGQW_21740, partial [bacterium]